MLFAILAIFALTVYSEGASTVVLYGSDTTCTTMSSSFNVTRISSSCQRQDLADSTRSVVVSAINCNKDTGVNYNFAVCNSNDCSGACDVSVGTVAFTTTEYAKYLAAQCAMQTINIAEDSIEYLKVVGTPMDFCDSGAMVVPSLLLGVLVLARSLVL